MKGDKNIETLETGESRGVTVNYVCVSIYICVRVRNPNVTY